MAFDAKTATLFCAVARDGKLDSWNGVGTGDLHVYAVDALLEEIKKSAE
jgi:hypothetical protein